ncbi:MAG: hypothetical protein Q7P63_11550 [Verrucomicrobiota bacterium JB022]|nr:hypothetical protein [Verrucomicrobiota bacterium JB022]
MKWMTRATLIGAATITAVGGYFWWAGTHTLETLVHENQALQRALSNLQQEEVVAYLRVLPLEVEPTITEPHLRVVLQEPASREAMPEPETHTIFGRQVYLEGVVVKFDNQLVSDGEERALLLWRRVFGDDEKPAEGADLFHETSSIPSRYREAFSAVPERVNQQFWSQIWEHAHDATAKDTEGIVAIYGSSVSIEPRPETLYVVLFTAQGQLYLRPAAEMPQGLRPGSAR